MIFCPCFLRMKHFQMFYPVTLYIHILSSYPAGDSHALNFFIIQDFYLGRGFNFLFRVGFAPRMGGIVWSTDMGRHRPGSRLRVWP